MTVSAQKCQIYKCSKFINFFKLFSKVTKFSLCAAFKFLAKYLPAIEILSEHLYIVANFSLNPKINSVLDMKTLKEAALTDSVNTKLYNFRRDLDKVSSNSPKTTASLAESCIEQNYVWDIK